MRVPKHVARTDRHVKVQVKYERSPVNCYCWVIILWVSIWPRNCCCWKRVREGHEWLDDFLWQELYHKSLVWLSRSTRHIYPTTSVVGRTQYKTFKFQWREQNPSFSSIWLSLRFVGNTQLWNSSSWGNTDSQWVSTSLTTN